MEPNTYSVYDVTVTYRLSDTDCEMTESFSLPYEVPSSWLDSSAYARVLLRLIRSQLPLSAVPLTLKIQGQSASSPSRVWTVRRSLLRSAGFESQLRDSEISRRTRDRRQLPLDPQ